MGAAGEWDFVETGGRRAAWRRRLWEWGPWRAHGEGGRRGRVENGDRGVFVVQGGTSRCRSRVAPLTAVWVCTGDAVCGTGVQKARRVGLGLPFFAYRSIIRSRLGLYLSEYALKPIQFVLVQTGISYGV
eukprot:3445769-Rhodomonas_salina.2